MRALTPSPRSIPCDDPIVDFDIEDIDQYQAGNPAAVQAEIDGIREAIRLNWLEMERSELLQTERRAIRANVARLVHILTALLALSGRQAKGSGDLETEDARFQNAQFFGPISHDAELLILAPPEHPQTVDSAPPTYNPAARQVGDSNA